jgi:uncharacterized protein (UPF0332 family)
MGEKMSLEYEECLERGKITKYSRGKTIAQKEFQEAKDDFKTAQESNIGGNHKWATVQAYYAMFHAARALLYHNGMREQSHHCLIIGIKEIYVKTGKLAVTDIEALQEAKSLREAADYHGKWSEESGKKMLDKAENFLKAAEILIKE